MESGFGILLLLCIIFLNFKCAEFSIWNLQDFQDYLNPFPTQQEHEQHHQQEQQLQLQQSQQQHLQQQQLQQHPNQFAQSAPPVFLRPNTPVMGVIQPDSRNAVQFIGHPAPFENQQYHIRPPAPQPLTPRLTRRKPARGS